MIIKNITSEMVAEPIIGSIKARPNPQLNSIEQSHDSNLPLLPSDHTNTELLTETEPEFLVPLLKSLARKSQKQMDINKAPRNSALFLEIALFDESPNSVNISFAFLRQDLQSWKDFNDHLADSLADVIQEAERHNFTSEFKYDIFVKEKPPKSNVGYDYGSRVCKSCVG